MIETTPALGWRETIDRGAERIKREIREMANSARRSLGQRIRWARQRAREAAQPERGYSSYVTWIVR